MIGDFLSCLCIAPIDSFRMHRHFLCANVLEKTVQKLGRFVKVSVGQSLGWHQCDDGAGEHNKTVTHPRLTRKIEVGKKKMKKKNEWISSTAQTTTHVYVDITKVISAPNGKQGYYSILHLRYLDFQRRIWIKDGRKIFQYVFHSFSKVLS